MEEASDRDEKIQIQLGDIIEIEAPTDPNLNEQQFLITYASPQLLRIASSDKNIELHLQEDGSFRNEAILSIAILSRAESPSYAVQNDLTPGSWIDVFFDGDVPLIITGKITNLEEDMIEIKPIDSEDMLYIDFGYKGIPEDLPIEKIVHRTPPATLKDVSPEKLVEVLEPTSSESIDEIQDVPISEVKEQIRDMIFQADQIRIGVELEAIVQEVQVPDAQQRFGIDKQTTDMLDELLSSVPNIQRTPALLNAIHTMIERYKQLRTEFSQFDNYNNALLPVKQGANYKPLVKSLEVFNQQLYWLLPCVANIKKLYDIDGEVLDETADVEPLTLAQTRLGEYDIINAYLDNDVPDGENNYTYLIKNLKPYQTPFLTPPQPQNYIANIPVQTDITAIVDNMDDYYSSVAHNDDVKRKRFLIQPYNTGQNILETQKISSGEIVTKWRQLTHPDVITLKGLIFLPEPTVHFSRINLPSTNIMMRADLNANFLMYWIFLNKFSLVSTTVVEDKIKSIDHDASTFLQGINEYQPDQTFAMQDDVNKYSKFLETVIPKTRVLFELVKPYIHEKLSMYEVISFLEPFLIYQKDISFKQYEEIIAFIHEKIINYKKNYAKRGREMGALSRTPSQDISPRLLALLEKDPSLKESVIEGYGLNQLALNKMTDAELYRIIVGIDYGRLLDDSIAIANSHLMVTGGLEKLTDLETWAQKNQTLNEESECAQLVLAKKYIAIDELEDDDNKEIYFDKQFDKTYYDLLEEYQIALDADLTRVPLESDIKMASIKILASKLIQNIGLAPNLARRDATAMLEGKRLVEDGDYAILMMEEDNVYYKRHGGLWIKSPDILAQSFGDDTKFFCNLNEKCFAIKDDCLDLNSSKAEIQADNVSQVLNEFDSDLAQNASEIVANITRSLQESLSRIEILRTMRLRQITQYDRERILLGNAVEIIDVPHSPHEDLRDLILGQADLAKRQIDIARFVAFYTRSPNDGENPYWLYCLQSNVQLLPTFFATLAQVFNDQGDYIQALAQICKQQGTLSDDGEAWVDKHSGYTIMAIDFETEDGFGSDKSGMGRYDMLEIDLGESIAKSPALKTYQSVEAEKIGNIINAMTGFLGIDLSESTEFIMRNTLSIQGRAMPTREVYEKIIANAQKKGKKRIDSYESAFNASLIIITLCYILIAIQTSIPSLTTRKTHPGCKKGSLFNNTGFPLEGDEDKSGLIYIACIAHKIRSSVEPWNAIRKTSEGGIAKKMEATLDKMILITEEVKQRIKEKLTYISQVEIDAVPIEHDIKTWSNFLPSLVPIKVKGLQNISSEFTTSLSQNLQKGAPIQLEKINVMRGKIMLYALGIQESIQKVVSEQTAILVNVVGEPYLENACCDDGVPYTFQYFATKEGNIIAYNNIIARLSDILDDLGRMAKAAILFDPQDTKFRYPKLPAGFSEETIYRAFIVFCKYNTQIPISQELRAICMDKPEDFDIQDSIEEKIRKLKRDGRNYSAQSLDELMSIINRQNIVHLELHTTVWSNIQILRDIIQLADSRDVTSLPQIFRRNYLAMLDSIDPTTLLMAEDTEAMRTMKNYLETSSGNMITLLNDFAFRNVSSSIAAPFTECITHIVDFVTSHKEYDDGMSKIVTFMKNAIQELTRILPNIVINQVDYSSVTVPRHWKLSERHNADIKDIIRKHYTGLSEFYGDEEIVYMLERIQGLTTDVGLLASLTYFDNPIIVNEQLLHSIFDKRMILLLFKYYFLTVLVEYTSILDDADALIRTVVQPVSVAVDNVFTSEQVAELETGNISELEIVTGEKRVLAEKIAHVLGNFIKIICTEKSIINFNYDTLMERILRSREKEKDLITDYLKEMSDEEREIENLFKNHKLERWSVGLQKGFTVYKQETYDKERDTMEAQALLELRLGQNSLVTAMNRDIYAMDAVAEETEATRIEDEELDMQHLPEDDDFGERDGDEDF